MEMLCASWQCIYIKENVLVLRSGALPLKCSNANSAKRVKGNILSPRCEYVNIFLTMHTTTYNASTVHAYLEMPYIMKIMQMLRKKKTPAEIRRVPHQTLPQLHTRCFGTLPKETFLKSPLQQHRQEQGRYLPAGTWGGQACGRATTSAVYQGACKNVISASGRTGSPRSHPPADSQGLRDGPRPFRPPLGSPGRQGELLAASSAHTARPAAAAPRSAAPGFPCSPPRRPPSPPAAPPPAAPAAARGPAPRPRDSGIRRRPAAR